MRDFVNTMTPAADALEAEIAALIALRDIPYGPQFRKACETIFDCGGKLVVTGMGKAGLIGQKISATLRSTGQPSTFLDPAQALHGDMGLIRTPDAVLALSNSGRTNEVLAVCEFARRNDVPTIAITGRADGPLADYCDTAIVYPDVPEGCPIGRAPMASAMMMLALGDALSAALMSRRGFTEADFLNLHHGGYLGEVISAQEGG